MDFILPTHVVHAYCKSSSILLFWFWWEMWQARLCFEVTLSVPGCAELTQSHSVCFTKCYPSCQQRRGCWSLVWKENIPSRVRVQGIFWFSWRPLPGLEDLHFHCCTCTGRQTAALLKFSSSEQGTREKKEFSPFIWKKRLKDKWGHFRRQGVSSSRYWIFLKLLQFAIHSGVLPKCKSDYHCRASTHAQENRALTCSQR